MANDNQKTIEIKALLDKSGIQADLEQVQKIVDMYPIQISPELDKTALQNHIQDIAKQMASEFNNTFEINLKTSDIVKVLDKDVQKSSSSFISSFLGNINTNFVSKVVDKTKSNFISKVADIGERMQVHTFQNIVEMFRICPPCPSR